MAKYLVKYDEWTEVTEQTGTIQNIDDGCPVEVSEVQAAGSGIILYPWEMKPFSNVQLYIRGYNKNPLPTEVRVVPFEVGQGGGGGGGSYVLPTATATRLGGVKIGNGITVAADGTISATGGAGISNWAQNTSYPLGVYVTYNNDLYLCTTAHTSTTTFDSSKWKKIGCDGCKIEAWATNTAYDAGDYVTYQNDLYLCVNQHTSGSTFDPTKWKLIGGTGSGIEFWAANTDYVAGNYVTYQNNLYLCTTAHTSGSTFDTSKWKMIGGESGGIDFWSANTDYVFGDYVTYQNKLYLCKTAHTSTSTFDSTKWQEIGELPIANTSTLGGVKIGKGISVASDGTISWSGIPVWAAAMAYSAGEYVTYNDDLYLCTTAHTSGATFDAAKWKKIGDLPIASSSTLGGVKIGAGITVAADGTISVDGAGGSISEWKTATAYDIGDYVTFYNYGRQEWQDDTAYSAGDFVTNGGDLYKCIVSHISGSIFANDLAANKWVQVPREGGLYICVKAHTSDDFHDDFIVDGKWVAIRNGIDFWSTTKHYEVGQYVTVPDDYKHDEWQANTAYAIGDFVKVYNRDKSEWATGTSYAVGDYATMGKALYRCETAHTSTSFANDVAAGDWTLVDTIVEQFSCLDSHTSSNSFATDFAAGKWKIETPQMETCVCLQEHISDDFAANLAAGKWQSVGGKAVEIARAWAVGINSPDDMPDSKSPNGKTQSSRTWALQSEDWAVSSGSPDNETDTDSPTGKTQSSKTWALSSKKSASDAEGFAEQTALLSAPYAYDATATYSYPDVVAYTDGFTYRCVGQNVTGVDPSTDPASWVCLMRVTTSVFEYDDFSDLMPVVNPVANANWEIDGNGDIEPAA